jgi:hypothetical protein
MKDSKRILTIKLIRETDSNPDTSYLGTYSTSPAGEFAIDRTHEMDCTVNLGGDICTCDMRHLSPGEYEFFNSGSVEPFNPAADWIPATETDKHAYWLQSMRENASRDYARMESYNAGMWSYIGILAQASIVTAGVCQTITSGGLWGIENDSDAAYLASVERDELANLRNVLHSLGFSRRAIAAAVKASK